MSDQYTPYPLTSVYLMRLIDFEYYKIGISRNVQARLFHIQAATPFEVVLIRSVALRHAYHIEQAIHVALDAYHVRREWFTGSCDEACRVFDLFTQNAVSDLSPLTIKVHKAPTKQVHWMQQLPEGAHRVTPEMVAEARDLAENHGMYQGQIATKLGISRATVNTIINRKRRFSD